MPRKKLKPAPGERAVHQRIAVLRDMRGISQSDLATAVGVTKFAVSNWERGLSAPSSKHLGAVADALGVTIDELLREAA